MNIGAALSENIGEAAARLHTARSRNDQVATDFRLYVRDVIDLIRGQINGLQLALVARAGQEAETVMPGFTHMQSAQPVTLGHHLLAYVEMLERDKDRLKGCFMRADSNPLGSCALSGSSLPIDRNYVTQQLGMLKTTQNSMDSVADRDFIIELLSDISIIGMHLSRLCEDLILWATNEFNFIWHLIPHLHLFLQL